MHSPTLHLHVCTFIQTHVYILIHLWMCIFLLLFSSTILLNFISYISSYHCLFLPCSMFHLSLLLLFSSIHHIFLPVSNLSLTPNCGLTVPPNTLTHTQRLAYMQCCVSDWWVSLWKTSHVAVLLFLASFTVAERAENVASIFLPPSAQNSAICSRE